MAIGPGETILAADIQAIQDDVDTIVSTSQGSVDTSQTTSSTSYTNLSTNGPAVTLTTGTKAKITVTCQLSNNTVGGKSFMSFAISGATTAAAADSRAMFFESATANQDGRFSVTHLVTGLTAGSNTFTAKYRVDSGTGTFVFRRILVEPLGGLT